VNNSRRFLLHQPFEYQALRRQVGNAPADVVEPCFGHANAVGITRQGPVLQVMVFDQLVEAMKDPQVFMAVPFGGNKSSGVGREFGSAFIDDYTELKSVMIRY